MVALIASNGCRQRRTPQTRSVQRSRSRRTGNVVRQQASNARPPSTDDGEEPKERPGQPNQRPRHPARAASSQRTEFVLDRTRPSTLYFTARRAHIEQSALLNSSERPDRPPWKNPAQEKPPPIQQPSPARSLRIALPRAAVNKAPCQRRIIHESSQQGPAKLAF